MDGNTTTQELRRLLETQLSNYTKALESCGNSDRWYIQGRIDELRRRLESLDNSEARVPGS